MVVGRGVFEEGVAEFELGSAVSAAEGRWTGRGRKRGTSAGAFTWR